VTYAQVLLHYEVLYLKFYYLDTFNLLYFKTVVYFTEGGRWTRTWRLQSKRQWLS